MRVLVLGGDGYIGWPLSQSLAASGHSVVTVDNGVRRARVQAMNSDSLVELDSFEERLRSAVRRGLELVGDEVDIEEPGVIEDLVRRTEPEVIVHLAQQPSAPYSMGSVKQAIETQIGNVTSTLRLIFAVRDHSPECHIIKLGTMGQYGTPDVLPLGEGYIDIVVDEMVAEIPMPKSPGSFYHASKACDSINLEMAGRLWSLMVTELNQGIVYGHHDGLEAGARWSATRFDYDEWFGTVVNRFLVQAVMGDHLTIYGKGTQTRGFIFIDDVLACIQLAIENPPKPGKLRVFNQMTQHLSVAEVASLVGEACQLVGLDSMRSHIPNPRIEREDHPYSPVSEQLVRLGLEPSLMSPDLLATQLKVVLEHGHRVKPDVIRPTHSWRSGHR